MEDTNKSTRIGPDELNKELRIPAYVYPYTAGIVGGLLGGIGMALVGLFYGLISGHGPWYPVNLVAAAVIPGMGTMTVQGLQQFSALALFVGLVIHLLVAAGVGLLFALLLPTLPGRADVWAILIGPILWFSSTLILLPSINPQMSRLLDWPSFAIANIVYGMVMGTWVTHTPRVHAESTHPLIFQPPTFMEHLAERFSKRNR